MPNSLATAVSVDRHGIVIEGRRTMVLCASLFYFRIPESRWEHRMRLIREAGYNCIDVYFPWNFHESSRDVWDFTTGMRDVDRFLSLAAANDLYVMARPGPYICSEWDGGGLPAYLFGDGIDIRQNDREYLARVEEWYSRIMPVIAAHQVDAGGSVVLVQIENELDFFACRDVPGYMGALADSARRHGVTVPLIACAGQRDINGAWGSVDGVVPTLNLYFDSAMPGMEDGVTRYARILADLDAPLMVTEMGRDNLLMRRLVASGAKLLGPYNQVAGFDFGFTNSVNNWGDPVAFQTSYYDFLSLVTPYGELRPFVADDRVLAGLFASLGKLLAGSFPAEPGSGAELRGPSGEAGEPPVLDLAGGAGRAIAVSNLADEDATYTLSLGGEEYPVALPGRSSAFVFAETDLAPLGVPARVELATAEPVYADRGEHPVLVWQAPVAGVVRVSSGEARVELVVEAGRETRASLVLEDGRTLELVGMGRADAARVTGFADGAVVRLDEPLPTEPLDRLSAADEAASKGALACSVAVAATSNAGLFGAERATVVGDGPLSLERNGVYRGYGLYAADGTAGRPVALVLHDAADVVSVYRGGAYVGTVYPGGDHAVVELPHDAQARAGEYELRAEIWGHSNFDDSRKPALRINSLRGISGLTEVTERRPLRWWTTQSPAGGRVPYFEQFGARLTTDRPVHDAWHAQLEVPGDADRVLLRFEGLVGEADVVVDGVPAGRADAFAHTVDISDQTRPGAVCAVTVHLSRRHFEEPAGTATALFGRPVTGWRLCGAEELELAADARRTAGTAQRSELPLLVPRGEMRWLHLTPGLDPLERDCKVVVTGSDCKATIAYNGRVCGRLFLPTEGGPQMRVAATLGYLPAGWHRAEGDELALLVEAVGPGEARLESVSLIPVE